LSTPYTLNHLTATILHTLLDTGELRVTRGVPREVTRIVETGQVIPELF